MINWEIILNSGIAVGIVAIIREIVIVYFSDRVQFKLGNKRRIAVSLLKYCSDAEARDFESPYEPELENYLINSLVGINKKSADKLKILSHILAYNMVARDLKDEGILEYKDEKTRIKEAIELCEDLKKISYRLLK